MNIEQYFESELKKPENGCYLCGANCSKMNILSCGHVVCQECTGQESYHFCKTCKTNCKYQQVVGLLEEQRTNSNNADSSNSIRNQVLSSAIPELELKLQFLETHYNDLSGELTKLEHEENSEFEKEEYLDKSYESAKNEVVSAKKRLLKLESIQIEIEREINIAIMTKENKTDYERANE